MDTQVESTNLVAYRGGGGEWVVEGIFPFGFLGGAPDFFKTNFHQLFYFKFQNVTSTLAENMLREYIFFLNQIFSLSIFCFPFLNRRGGRY